MTDSAQPTVQTEQAAADLRLTGLWRSQRGRSLGLLAIAVLLLWIVMMSVFPALPAMSRDLGVGPATLGFVLAASSLLMTLLNVPAGVISDRFGRSRPIVIGLAVCAIGIALSAITNVAALFIVGWVVFGVGRGLFLSPTFTVPADLYGPQERGKAIGVLASSLGAGSVLGYVGAGLLLIVSSWHTILIIDTFVLVAVTVITRVGLRESQTARNEVPLARAAAQTAGWFSDRVVLVSGLVSGLSFAVGVAATFLVPFSLSNLHASALVIAAVFVPYEVVASVGTMIVGSASDRVGRKPPLLIALVAVTLTLLALPVVGISVWSLAAVYALIGLTEAPMISLSTSIVADAVLRIDPRRLGSALGANRLLQGLGPVGGPILGGLLAREAGLSVRYWVLSGALALVFCLALFLREPKPVGGQA
jgi:MFS family permease